MTAKESPMGLSSSESKGRFALRWIGSALVAVALAAAVSAVAGEGAADGPPVTPRLVWSAAEGRLIAMATPEVRGWWRGEVDDPGGLYASWYERFDRQRRSPGFSAALFELQRLVAAQVERGLTKFQVENELIPALLRERVDLARGLSGETPTVPYADPQCYRIESGTEYCAQIGFACCFGDFSCCCDWGCNLRSAGSCSVTEPIPCPGIPAGPNGTMDMQRN